MNQERIKAIEDLEKILKPLDACEPQCKLNLNPEKIRKVIALLRTEQLPASEFTKECRELRKQGADDEEWEYATKLGEACIILDRSEAEIKKYIEMDKYKSKQIILGTENYNKICKTVEQLAATIKELERKNHCAYSEGRNKGFEDGKRNVEELEIELKELGELRIIFDDDSALRHVIKLREEIKELKKAITELKSELEGKEDLAHFAITDLQNQIERFKEIINHAVDGIDVLSKLNRWPEGQMKKDVMAIKETLEK